MKTIRTAGGWFLTGTEIADAVTAYGLALARARDLDVVDIPFVTDAGSVSRAQFRIGWLIDMVVTAGLQLTDELIDVDTIFGLLAKSRSLNGTGTAGERPRTTFVRDDANWDEVI